MDAISELRHLLRPCAGGLYLVSTGRAEQLALQHQLYGVSSDEAVEAAFVARLERVRTARVVVLGVPSDTGAGFRRGASIISFTPKEPARFFATTTSTPQ